MHRMIDDAALWDPRLGELRICFTCRYWARYALARKKLGGRGGCTLSGQHVSQCMIGCPEFRWRRKAAGKGHPLLGEG